MPDIPYVDTAHPAHLPSRVRVYRNLHKRTADGRPVYSVMDDRTRKVVMHVAEITLTEVTFLVYETGRQRVLKERAKNVHAFVQGTPSELAQQPLRAHYDPYEGPCFVDADTLTPIPAAASATVGSEGVTYTPIAA